MVVVVELMRGMRWKGLIRSGKRMLAMVGHIDCVGDAIMVGYVVEVGVSMETRRGVGLTSYINSCVVSVRLYTEYIKFTLYLCNLSSTESEPLGPKGLDTSAYLLLAFFSCTSPHRDIVTS